MNNVIFLQLLLSTVFAAPLLAREDGVIVTENTQGTNIEAITGGVIAQNTTDNSTVEILGTNASGAELKQNLCLCPSDCVGSCCSCGGCPSKGSCTCKPCDSCGLVDCLCPSKWCHCGKDKCECPEPCEPVPEPCAPPPPPPCPPPCPPPPCEPEPEPCHKKRPHHHHHHHHHHDVKCSDCGLLDCICDKKTCNKCSKPHHHHEPCPPC